LACCNDDITRAIEALTIRLWVYRHVRRETSMPLEIKGLKSNMLKVGQRIERLNTKALAFDEIGGQLEQGLDDITAQAKAHQEDLTFAATVLGNSSTASGEIVEKPKLPPVVIPPNELKTPDEPPAPQQTTILNGSSGMGDLNQAIMHARNPDVQLIRS
jgi:hypothetical protein